MVIFGAARNWAVFAYSTQASTQLSKVALSRERERERGFHCIAIVLIVYAYGTSLHPIEQGSPVETRPLPYHVAPGYAH